MNVKRMATKLSAALLAAVFLAMLGWGSFTFYKLWVNTVVSGSAAIWALAAIVMVVFPLVSLWFSLWSLLRKD